MAKQRAQTRGQMRALDRRAFLKRAAGQAAGAALAPLLAACSAPAILRPAAKRVVLVRFGGGVRFRDVFADQNSCLAPHLRHLSESGTLFAEMWNDHLTRHDAATLYLLTGRYGARLDDNGKGAENVRELSAAPTLFEVFRRARGAPRMKALAAGTPDQSSHPSYGAPFCALTFGREGAAARAASISGDPSLGSTPHVAMANDRLARIVARVGPTPVSPDLKRRNFEAAVKEDLASVVPEVPELAPVIHAALVDRLLADRPYVPPEDADHWLADLALRALASYRPDLAVIAFSTPDLAHRGAWRSYAAAVKQIDIHVHMLWRFLETDPYYRGRTLLLVTSDCGRGDERFDRHLEPFADPAHRRVFLVAAGAGARSGLVVTERRQQVDVGVTAAAVLGCALPDAEGSLLAEIAT